ncbi:HAMP domain-containing sensor histidine kinase [Dyadobacter sp. CY347]|uniref:sensor histidine kinase n=1 Tax=Dyadobacter sp. CY347 TaxID=2909336 RepID=UPI001F1EEE8C|nr:HAMP domain-containing sensor histidine kinase [Dyadobacter sp. CY347]MCF2486621.1 HAMP domain-containing histidine kinase [Dyadobacter sp. CY347]
MKLLQKTSRIYLFASLTIYVAVGIAFFWSIKYMIYDEVESRLKVEKRDFEAYVEEHDEWLDDAYFVENKIEVTPTHGNISDEVIFKDTVILNRYEGTLDPFRQVTFYASIDGDPHRVVIRKSMIQSYKLIEAISGIMIAFLALLMVGMFFFQRRLSGKIWQPFYESLANIKDFDWTKNKKLELPKSEITEFNELEDVMVKMASKMQHDYKSLKEFTENASHEMQTPLALINARVEQFIQTGDLGKEQTYWIEEIYHASRRISRLNQGLLLLAKIENQQFTDHENTDLSELAAAKLKDFEDIISHRNIQVNLHCDEKFIVNMSPALAEILIVNLVNNAIRHNHQNGELSIKTGTGFLEVSNTGNALRADPASLFNRFKKESASGESLGLGLAIVKQICDNYGLQIAYHNHESLHKIQISV